MYQKKNKTQKLQLLPHLWIPTVTLSMSETLIWKYKDLLKTCLLRICFITDISLRHQVTPTSVCAPRHTPLITSVLNRRLKLS